MILLQTSKLTKVYGGTPILENVQFEVKKGDRVAVVGRNGAGKSTLLKMIAGEIIPDSGEIHQPQSTLIGYFAQSSHIHSNSTIFEEMLSVFQDTILLKTQLEELSLKMAEIDPASEEYLKVLNQYQFLNHQFESKSGYTYEAEINNILNRFKFDEIGVATRISSLSGGQKTRLALAKLLLQKPDVLILDEPTNHLDIDTIEWLEGYLKKYAGSIVIVSHDRYFLDQIANVIYEIEFHKCTRYKGNYSDYIDQKAVVYASMLKQYEKQQKEISKLEDFISRNIVRASTTKRAQSRRKQLDKMERIDVPHLNDKSMGLSFETLRRSGNDVLTVSDLAVGYPDKGVLSEGLNFNVRRQDRVALIGPNGIGKSTIMKTLSGKLDPLHGNIRFGSSLDVGYFDQEQAELTSSSTVLNEIWNHFPNVQEKDIRTLLGNFLFSGDDVFKTVNQLSGGEKVRLALSKLMLEKNNFIMLDEPTNHLDIDSKEMLELALDSYEGTVLFISHDRYFIDKIATQVLEVVEGGLNHFLGNYSDYVEKKEQIQRLEAEKEGITANSEETMTDYEAQKQQRRLENQRRRLIEELEQRIAAYEEELAYKQMEIFQEEVYLDSQKSAQVQARIEELENLLMETMEEWEAQLSLEV